MLKAAREKQLVTYKGLKSCHLNSTDGPKGYYAKWNKSDRERQITYEFTYMWNLKNEAEQEKT